MKVRFIKPLFVSERTYAEDEVGEFTEEQAKRVIESGHGELVKATETLEVATLEVATETATTKTKAKAK